MEYRIGIDPGVSGAVALLGYDGDWPKLIRVTDMPLLTLTGRKQQINPVELSHILRGYTTVNKTVVYLEQVGAMPGQGVVSMFNFGMCYGMIQGVVASLHIPLVLVRPNVWKRKAALLNADKDKARTYAQQLFPEADLKRKKDIGRADAILIAMFGK